MKVIHSQGLLFFDQTPEVQQSTLKYHTDFYEATGKYKNEVAYRLCKCTIIPAKTTRAELYIHSIEASHYPLIECPKCGILMEREDSQEH